MIVSTSSWHYRLYAWTKTFWSNFEGKSFNQLPDLCSYISTILLQAPVTALFWLLSNLLEAISNGFETAVLYCFKTPKRSTISIAVVVCLLTAFGLTLAVYAGVPFRDAAFTALKFWGSGLAAAATVFGGLGLVFKVFPYLFDKATSKGASFVQLTKTWVNDGAGKRFCRTLTFVD
jgi:hypothetical protein